MLTDDCLNFINFLEKYKLSLFSRKKLENTKFRVRRLLWTLAFVLMDILNRFFLALLGILF